VQCLEPFLASSSTRGDASLVASYFVFWRYYRRGLCTGVLLTCLPQVIINLMEHVPSMPVLLVGRVLGGLSTSLLFTAFESWMVRKNTILEGVFLLGTEVIVLYVHSG
jgi:hypothetical protein